MRNPKRILQRLLASSLVACVVSLAFPAPIARAQERVEEIVANLAAGRVIVYVAKDGIAIAALQNPIEPGSHPPLIVPLSDRRVGILLGAVDWILPDSGRIAARLDGDLTRLVPGGPRRASRPQQEQGQANDIEETGLALLEPIRTVAENLHGLLNLPPEEPLVDLLLVEYAPDYGPEVWNLQYRLKQEPLRGDFWQTRVLRPSYMQLYPPEKHHPHTLVEVQYPPENMAPGALDLLERGDPGLGRIRSADPHVAQAIEHLERGETQKARVAGAAAFVRAAVAALAPPETEQAVAVIQEDTGFAWVVRPHQPPETPQAARERTSPQPPGAPSLRKRPSPQ